MIVLRFAPSWISTAALLAFLITPTPAAASSDLLLPGYRLEEVGRDTSEYSGNSTGVVIHEGDHLHDPCTEYIPGERFTLIGGTGEGRGFVVVNDCQVVECTKWWVESDGGGNAEGLTVVYDLVPNEDDNSESVTTRWSVLESGSCSYVGKFFHKDEDNGDCEVNGTPGSISCTGDEPEPSMSAIVLDTAEKVGISIGTILGAAGIAMLLLYFLCCRKKKNKESNSVATEEYDEERGVRSKSAMAATTAAAGTSSRWKLFGSGTKNKKETRGCGVSAKEDKEGPPAAGSCSAPAPKTRRKPRGCCGRST